MERSPFERSPLEIARYKQSADSKTEQRFIRQVLGNQISLSTAALMLGIGQSILIREILLKEPFIEPNDKRQITIDQLGEIIRRGTPLGAFTHSRLSRTNSILHQL